MTSHWPVKSHWPAKRVVGETRKSAEIWLHVSQNGTVHFKKSTQFSILNLQVPCFLPQASAGCARVSKSAHRKLRTRARGSKFLKILGKINLKCRSNQSSATYLQRDLHRHRPVPLRRPNHSPFALAPLVQGLSFRALQASTRK